MPCQNVMTSWIQNSRPSLSELDDRRQVCDPPGDLSLPADRDYTCEDLRAVRVVPNS